MIKRILILLLSVFLLFGCSNKDESIDITKLTTDLEYEVNDIYNELDKEFDNINKTEILIEYYDWKKIWNIDFMEEYQYVTNLSSSIQINDNDQTFELNIKYDLFKTGYRIYYTFVIQQTNLKFLNEINVISNSFNLIIDILSEKTNISKDKFIKIDEDFKEKNIETEFEKKKYLDNNKYFYENNLEYYYLDSNYNYQIEQNIQTTTYNFKCSLIENSTIKYFKNN